MSEEVEELQEEIPQKRDYDKELIYIIKATLDDQQLRERLDDYHYNDLADVWGDLSKEEHIRLFNILGAEEVSEIFAYMEDDAAPFLAELGIEKAADILEEMDADDAVDILEELDDEQVEKLVAEMDDEAVEDIDLIQSYSDEEIGSKMTTNFIVIYRGLNVKNAMSSVIAQAEDNDNIATIYVVDDNDEFYGAIELKDLITARENTPLDDIIRTSYPYVFAKEQIDEVLEELKDYEEDSIPVLENDKTILGVITSQDIVEVVDEDLSEDYAMFAGLTEPEDLKESTKESMRKRLPWLIILLFLSLLVSSVVGMFEAVVATLTLAVAFQSLILDMSGNVGTQSLAVTIRVLMDESLTAGQKVKLVFKEMRVGFCNGLLLGTLAFIFIGLYIMLFKGKSASFAYLTSACIGFSLMVSMTISSGVGTIVPMGFHKFGVDPAVASGPLITTVNDLVAVITYYGLCWLLLINVFHLG